VATLFPSCSSVGSSWPWMLERWRPFLPVPVSDPLGPGCYCGGAPSDLVRLGCCSLLAFLPCSLTLSSFGIILPDNLKFSANFNEEFPEHLPLIPARPPTGLLPRTPQNPRDRLSDFVQVSPMCLLFLYSQCLKCHTSMWEKCHTSMWEKCHTIMWENIQK
jgi:hypothetical protein